MQPGPSYVLWLTDWPRELNTIKVEEPEGRKSFFFLTVFNFFSHLFLLVGGQLLFNIVVVFAIHWHGFTCVPHPDPPSHLPLHPIRLGLLSAPAEAGQANSQGVRPPGRLNKSSVLASFLPKDGGFSAKGPPAPLWAQWATVTMPPEDRSSARRLSFLRPNPWWVRW